MKQCLTHKYLKNHTKINWCNIKSNKNIFLGQKVRTLKEIQLVMMEKLMDFDMLCVGNEYSFLLK